MATESKKLNDGPLGMEVEIQPSESRKFDFSSLIQGYLQLGYCAGGIFCCYFVYAMLQEQITRGKYVHDGKEEMFTDTIALVFVQCVVNYLYGLFVAHLNSEKAPVPDDSTPNRYYAFAALTYLTAMFASNKALLWVNYPFQVVAKSCKPIPVMVLSVLIGGQRYPVKKYFFVLLIVIGVAFFMYKDGNQSGKIERGAGEIWGTLLLLLSLTCDGLTGSIQERMKKEHKTHSTNMMISMNKWSICFLGFAVLATGEFRHFTAFIKRHPMFLEVLACFATASAFGQYFIFLCVGQFGALPCSIVTTTRKFFTVLASVFFFDNVLSLRQWMGASLVFIGLFLDILFGKKVDKSIVKKVS